MPTYSYNPGPFNFGRLSDELVAAGVPVLTLRGTTTSVDVVCDTGSWSAAVAAVIATHDGTPTAPTTGAQGIQGIQGVQGNPGTNGTNGTNGSTGPAGPAPSGTGFVRVTGGVLDPVVGFGSTSGTICQGSDSRLSDARTPTAHTHAESEVTGLVSDLAAKAASSDARFLTTAEPSAGQRVLMSCLAPGSAGFLLLTGVGYWVYLGRVVAAFTPKFVEFHVSTIGAGTQTAEVGFFSTTSAPKKAAQSLTKIVSTATVDALTGLGVKRNTSAFATSVAAGTHLWAGIRTAMVTTQPTIWGVGADMAQGQILSLAAAGALTGTGPWAGALVAAATGVGCPDLRGTLD